MPRKRTAAKKKTAPKKKTAARRKGADIEVRRAAAGGKSKAADVLAQRAVQQRKRARAVAAASTARAFAAPPRISARTLSLVGAPASAGTIIAEGDSWFDYPFHDVLKMLEDEHAFEVESVAHRGDRVEDMAFAPGQLDEFSRRLEKVLRNGTIPRAIVLSGGGNDIAGEEFGMLLNHAASPIAGLNEDIVTGVIDKRVKTSYAFVIGAITAISQKYLNRPLPIVVHGYDYPVPDGRGFLGGFWLLPGPWLKPGFEEKGFDDVTANTAMMTVVIDRFNRMLRELAGQFDNVYYIDLRTTLPNDNRYRTYWANELHPTERGFSMVANQFAALINSLP